MTAAPPDKLNNVHNVLTGWHDQMSQACSTDGLISVNASDVAELKQALADLAEAQQLRDLKEQMAQFTVDEKLHEQMVQRAGAVAITALAEQGRKYGLSIVTQNTRDKTSDAAFDLMSWLLADTDAATRREFADRLAINCKSPEQIQNTR
ncbi:MAG: hypothetical protein ACFHHU_00195 [Porticoccaceae bacterium]